MAPPWGIRWRKCDPRRSLNAPSTLRRRSTDVSRGFQKTSQKNIDFRMPFWLHFGSSLPKNSVNFCIMFRIRFWTGFRSHLFRCWCHFRPSEHSILMLSCRRRAIFRVFAMPLKISKKIQNLSKIASKICQKCFKNQLKKQPKMTSDFASIFSSKMQPKWPQNGREKSEKIWLWASWAAKAAPKDPQSHPSVSQSSQYGP